MCPNSMYFGLKVVPIKVLWVPKYIQFGHMGAWTSGTASTLQTRLHLLNSAVEACGLNPEGRRKCPADWVKVPRDSKIKEYALNHIGDPTMI